LEYINLSLINKKIFVNLFDFYFSFYLQPKLCLIINFVSSSPFIKRIINPFLDASSTFLLALSSKKLVVINTPFLTGEQPKAPTKFCILFR